MKLTLCFILTATFAFSQSDKASAAYFKAQSDLAAAKISHAQMMENIKTALDNSVKRQADASQALSERLNDLRLSCPKDQDLDFALLNIGTVKCVAKEQPKPADKK